MRIGLLSVWYERGQAYVTWTLRKALEEAGHECYVLARGGTAGDGIIHLEQEGIWRVPNLQPVEVEVRREDGRVERVYPYHIHPDVLRGWIAQNRLDAVIFNEEYDWYMVWAAKEAGVRVLTYLDYYKDEWARPLGTWRRQRYVSGHGWCEEVGKDRYARVFGWIEWPERATEWLEVLWKWRDTVPMRLYDAVLCSSHRSLNMVKDVCNAHYIGWAVDTELFKPPTGERPYTFFHNAGWFGQNLRKNTPAAIRAFARVADEVPSATLLVHAQQTDLSWLPDDVREIVEEHPRIERRWGTLPAPGLYHMGRVLLFPTKLEGLGLPLFEALACGMPVIATDAPPMNEYIIPGETGYLVPVAETVRRDDGIAIPETLVDEAGLADALVAFADAPDDVERMGRNARAYAEEHLRIADLGQRVSAVLEGICA